MRGGGTTLFAALNTATGPWSSGSSSSGSTRRCPFGLDVHLICDNASTHRTSAIQRWLAAHPRFHVRFTPASRSWLNQVERWFGLLTDKQIGRGVHKNVHALEKDIRTWIKTWNEDPKPFVWTKTADEIPERLAGYLNRITDSGH
ncbi:transposase [Streptomyces antibioticus]|uniref:transposase n=1 Tax=Streptomyces antibioticus TaxID=1890 RepID=UPI0036CE4169